jgi:hypothetical protein
MVPDGPNQRFTDFNGPHVVPGGPSSKIGSPDYDKCYAAATGYLIKLFLNRNKQKGTKGELARGRGHVASRQQDTRCD